MGDDRYRSPAQIHNTRNESHAIKVTFMSFVRCVGAAAASMLKGRLIRNFIIHSKSFILAAASVMRAIFVTAFVFLGPAMTSAWAHMIVEEVYVAESRTNDDRAILIRASGESYAVEKGHGCVSLWRYEGRPVLIISPGQFLAMGSKVVLPQSHQQCSVWMLRRAPLWVDPTWMGTGD